MPWRAQSQPFQTVRNLPFVRRDLPTICEELGAMSLLPGDRWSYGWVNLRNLLDTVLTATGTCYILNPPIDECSPPAGDIPNSFACLISPPSNNLLWQWKITHLQMILLYDPNKMFFFSFFPLPCWITRGYIAVEPIRMLVQSLVFVCELTRFTQKTWPKSPALLLQPLFLLGSITIYCFWLVVYLPLWKIWKSVGMMTFPTYGK